MEFFALVRTSKPIVVLKRAWNSYRRMEEIARTVRILYIVRHPFDVLTSHNPATGKQYHIEPDRWLGEMTELRKLVEADDPRHLVVRYEDLVGDTEATLGRIGETFDLSLVASPDEIMGRIELPGGTRTAMHGLRPVDSNSVGRYRGDPEAVERLRAIVPGLGETLEWVAGRFGYDIALP